MRSLNGSELAEYIKERQAKQVRALRQANKIFPKLAIVLTIDSPVINTYIKLKRQYGSDILIDVEVHKVKQKNISQLIESLNQDSSVHAIIVQLPLEQPEKTEEVVNLVAPEKDVDGLGGRALFDPATPIAILWLLSGYNIDLIGKNVLLVGLGKLVGTPLRKILIDSGIEPDVADINTEDLKAKTLLADVIISATGVGGLIKSDMLKPKAVVVDAGVASEGAKTAGDVDPEVYELRDDLTITPAKGGVGPLTVCALFDNVIHACLRLIES